MANTQNTGMGEENIGRLLLRFSLPATVAMTVNASYNIVDTIFVGRLGARAVAALSVSFPVQMGLGALAIGTGVGAGSLISRSLGAGQKRKAAAAAGQVLFLCLMMGFLAALAGAFYLDTLIAMLGSTAETAKQANEYLSIVMGGSTLIFLTMTLNHVIRAEGNAIWPMKVMVISAVSNIIMDPIFIFVLRMGVQGAAVATILAKAIAVAMQFHYFWHRNGSLKLKFAHLLPDWRIIREIYLVGIPSLLIQIAANISLVVANNILAAFGYVPIAVMGLIVRLQLFAFMPVIGIAQGLLPIVGYNFGAGKMGRVREAIIKAGLASTVVTTVIGLSYFFFPDVFLRIFTSEAEVLSVGVPAMRIAVAMYPLIGAQTIAIVFFHAIGKGLPSLLLSVSRQFILYIPFILILPSFFSLTGIWLSTPLADLLAFIVTIWVVSLELKRQGIPLLLPGSGGAKGRSGNR